MKTQLKFGLSQAKEYAPKWLINTTSLLALMIAAKHHLISELPLFNDAIKSLAMAWVDYILDTIQVLLAIAVIFSGEHKTSIHNDRTGH